MILIRTSKGGNGGYRDDVESMEDESSGRDRDMEGRYGALYEQRMNPFEEVSTAILNGKKCIWRGLGYTIELILMLKPAPPATLMPQMSFLAIPHQYCCPNLLLSCVAHHINSLSLSLCMCVCCVALQFSHIEKQRRLQGLSVADRIVLNTTLAFISSKSGRRYSFYLVSLQFESHFLCKTSEHVTCFV